MQKNLKKRVVLSVLGLVVVAAVVVMLFRTGSAPSTKGLASNGPAGQVGQNRSAVPMTSSSLPSTNAPSNAVGSKLGINPYAGALREPGKSKRNWDMNFMKAHQPAAAGEAIEFELTEGRRAKGVVKITQYRNGELSYFSGELSEPEKGEFFFLTPPAVGVAGKAVGVVQFPASQTAYRIEPTGPGGEPELWQRRLEEVICVGMPKPVTTAANAATNTNQPAESTPLRPDEFPTVVPSYNSNIVSLQSLPGAKGVLLLDFAGGYTPTWGGVYYSKPAGVNDSTIRDVWKRVAEDFMPFNINVTTDIKVYLAAPETSRQRCAFTDTPVTAAGVAFIGSWNWGGDTPCWSVVQHREGQCRSWRSRAGHTLGPSHQGQWNGVTTTNEYYGGQGSGETGWAPIMGVGYYQPVATWAKGEYNAANQFENELSIIVNNNNDVDYRADDTGNVLATARYLEVYPDESVSAEGVIEITGDTDAFQFTTTGGRVSLTARPVGDWANLGLAVVIADSANVILHTNNPQNTLWAGITTNLAAGTYTFRVIGVGKNDPVSNGFSAYASLGYYSIVGTVTGGSQPTRLSVVEHVANGSVVGTVPPNAAGNLAYTIASGNSSGTFAIDGSSGVLSVASNTLLDYEQRATNSMYFAGFELFVNILNLENPGQDELNRRVVVNVLSTNTGYPVAVTGFNAGIILPYNATAASPQATGFDVPNNWAFYQEGLNGNAQINASGQGLQGLPTDHLLRSQVDGSIFELGPYGGQNALMLGNGYPASGTLTLTTPRPFNRLAILATSANGGGLGTLVLNFTNGTKSQVFNLNAQDWYNTTANVAAQGFGRVRLGQATFSTENPGGNNPNIYQTTIDLAALGLNQTVASISITNPAVGGSRTTAILGVSGLVMPSPVAITRQPISATNNVPTSPVTFNIAAMGAPSLGYQWYKGNPGSGTPLAGQTGTNLVLNSIQLTDAGNYYVVATNASSSATSGVATLTVYRAPQIAQQPGPASSTRAVGQSISYSVVANAALPVNYYWRSNGVFIPGATASTLSLVNLQSNNAANYSVVVSNAYGSVVSVTNTLTIVPPNYPYAQLVLAASPMGYWRLDELSGPTALDCVGGRNGTYNNTQLGQPGYNLVDTHKSARFGFLAAQNSYVGGIPVDFGSNANNSLTVEAWVKGTVPGTDAGLITKGTGSGGEQFNLDCGGGGHAYRFFVRKDDGGAVLATGNIVPNNQWQHVVGVLNRSAGYVALYVNGVSNAASAFPTENYRGLLRTTNAMTIGARQGGTTIYDNQFAGYLQDVAVYNYALSAGQILAHYQAASNRAPAFVANPFTKPGVVAGQNYAGTLSGDAADPNGDTITFSKISGPSWLLVAGNGALAGTPLSAQVGTNSFVIRAADPSGLFSNATLNLNVTAAPAIVLGLARQEPNLVLSWSGGIPPYQVQTTTNLDVPAWENVGGTTSGFNLPVTPSNAASYYRIFGQ
ncbi:MAG: LamG-like jellyroll fold domain-containing protein [Verrucomicrobiota bacterium]